MLSVYLCPKVIILTASIVLNYNQKDRLLFRFGVGKNQKFKNFLPGLQLVLQDEDAVGRLLEKRKKKKMHF
jgi:hypothetical protein